MAARVGPQLAAQAEAVEALLLGAHQRDRHDASVRPAQFMYGTQRAFSISWLVSR